jgi:hypothetical protein
MPKNISWLDMVELKPAASACTFLLWTDSRPVSLSALPNDHVIPIYFRFSLAKACVKLGRPYCESQGIYSLWLSTS